MCWPAGQADGMTGTRGYKRPLPYDVLSRPDSTPNLYNTMNNFWERPDTVTCPWYSRELGVRSVNLLKAIYSHFIWYQRAVDENGGESRKLLRYIRIQKWRYFGHFLGSGGKQTAVGRKNQRRRGSKMRTWMSDISDNKFSHCVRLA